MKAGIIINKTNSSPTAPKNGTTVGSITLSRNRVAVIVELTKTTKSERPLQHMPHHPQTDSSQNRPVGAIRLSFDIYIQPSHVYKPNLDSSVKRQCPNFEMRAAEMLFLIEPWMCSTVFTFNWHACSHLLTV